MTDLEVFVAFLKLSDESLNLIKVDGLREAPTVIGMTITENKPKKSSSFRSRSSMFTCRSSMFTFFLDP